MYKTLLFFIAFQTSVAAFQISSIEFVSNIRLIRVVKTVGAFRLIGYKSEKRKGSSPQLVSVSTKIDTVLSVS